MKVGSFKRKSRYKDQEIFEFSNCYLFTLKERYYTAGKRHWREAIEQGEPTPGFSVNSSIWSLVDLEKLLVFEIADSRFFKLVDLDKARRLKGIEHHNQITLHVLPLSAFQSVEVEDLENILNSPVDLARDKFTTRQLRLKVRK